MNMVHQHYECCRPFNNINSKKLLVFADLMNNRSFSCFKSLLYYPLLFINE